jgi:hypothetical protein
LFWGEFILLNFFIEKCPPGLLSSNRSFISKVDVIELGGSDELCGKGYELSLFLFSDVLEISKKKLSKSEHDEPSTRGSKKWRRERWSRPDQPWTTRGRATTKQLLSF